MSATNEKLKGSCLCGGVHFEVDPPFETFVYCYCSRCRKKSGTSRISPLLVEPHQLRWTKGEPLIRSWEMPEARSFGTAFCNECGTPLPRLSRSGRKAMIPAGAIDGDIPIKPLEHRYWSSRANWIELDETHLSTC